MRWNDKATGIQPSVIEQLDFAIDHHAACDNVFFRWVELNKLSTLQLRSYAPDYFFFIRSFPAILSTLIANVRDDWSRFFLAQILFSELGSGNEERMHFKLFARLLSKLGMTEEEINSGPKHEQTKRLVDGMLSLYSDPNPAKALGAQYALEKMALPMIEKLYRGFKHYDLSIEDMDYFELHLVDEPEHLDCMRRCIAAYIGDSSSEEEVMTGACSLLNLFADFWKKEYEVIKSQV